VKQAIFAYVNHARIRSWNQPVLNNVSKVSCSRKQWEPLTELKLTTDRLPLIKSQTHCVTPKSFSLIFRFMVR